MDDIDLIIGDTTSLRKVESTTSSDIVGVRQIS
jgi:hypothetical protein